jgi:exodeoxyribonuclease VII large subunit
VGVVRARFVHIYVTLPSVGLFDPDRKRPLPFLPDTVGLICGRAGAAEKDVVENARRRWPTVRFAIREVAVQGGSAVQEVMAALQGLDADPEVDVIVIARGGGSVEDLLPFSNEALVRAVAAARTPVVSAIGHDVDTPLLDHVADWRASTPTDAGKRVVPDAQAERHGIRQSRDRGRRALHGRVASERRHLTALQSRPVMARPVAMIDARRQELDALTDRAHRRVLAAVHRAADQVEHLRVQVRTLSPLSTLERGYAVVQHRDGRVVTDRAAVVVDEVLRVRVARGDFAASVVGLPDDAG